MVDCEHLTEQAKSQGVELYGISVCEIPAKRLGIRATKAIVAGSCLLFAPDFTLKTILTLPGHIRIIEGCTVNGLLAAELATSAFAEHDPWRATLPTINDLRMSMPIYWPESLQNLLPFASLTILEAQRDKIHRDWLAVSAALDEVSHDIYLFSWLVVSTRTFFYTCDEIEEIYGSLHSDDCLALVPYADYFHHADTGCDVKYAETGYNFIADRDIAEGEEICFSYGNHNNDFFLIEYGFVPDQNQWDEMRLDEMILPLLSVKQQKLLQDFDYLGRYVLGDDYCYRTQAVLRLLIMPVDEWQRSLQEGFDNGDEYQEAVDKQLLAILLDAQAATERIVNKLANLDSGYIDQCSLLQRRWQQIQIIIHATVRRIALKWTDNVRLRNNR